MKKLLLILCLGVLQANAQLTTNDINLSLRSTGASIDLNRYPDIKGTPYLVDKWQKGELVLAGGTKQEISSLKFNCFINQLEYEEEGKLFTPINRYDGFTIYETDENNISRNRVFRNGLKDDVEFKTYFEILYDGKVKLVQKYGIRIDEYAEPLSLTRVRRFTKVPQMYIYHEKANTLIKIKKDKKSFLAAFSDKSTELESYLNDKKFKLKTEAEIKMACMHYDTLIP